MGGKHAPAVLGNILIGDGAISNTPVLVLAQSLVKIGKSDFPPRIPAQNSTQFPKEPNPRAAFHVNSDGSIGALGDGPEKRLLELEALPARRAELGKKKTGLPLGSQREIGVGQVKHGDIHEIEGPASDNRFTFAAQIDLVGRHLPRGRAGLTETGGKKSFIDMIGLPGKFLQPFPAHAEVAGFEKNLTLVDRGSLLLQIELSRFGLHLPQRIIDRDLALCLCLLGFPVETNFIGLQDHLLTLELHISFGLDPAAFFFNLERVCGEVNLLPGFLG